MLQSISLQSTGHKLVTDQQQGPFLKFPFILDEGLKKHSCTFFQENILPMFSCRSLIVSILTVWCLIHFELIYVCGIKE